jgi:hypothetical protein
VSRSPWLHAATAAGLVALLVVTASPAQASASGKSLLTNNAWIIADLAGTAASQAGSGAATTTPSLAVITDPQGKLDPVLWDTTNSATGRNVPTSVGRTPATTVLPKAKPPGKVGMFLNTGAMLLALGGLNFSPDDLVTYAGPALPISGTPGSVSWIGQAGGYWSGAWQTGSVRVEMLSQGTWTSTGFPTVAWQVSGWSTSPSGLASNNDLRVTIVLRTLCGDPGSGANAVWQTGGNSVMTGKTGYAQMGTLSGSCISPKRPIRYEVWSTHDTQQGSVESTRRSLWLEGAPGAPTGQPDPVEITTTLECSGPGGVDTITAKSVMNIAPPAEWVPPSASCPTGSVAKSGKVTGLIGGEVVPLTPTTTAAPWVQALPQLGADTSGATKPELWVNVGTETQPEWKPCTQAQPGACAEWLSRPVSELTRFRCQIGTVVVDRAACGRHDYDPITNTPTARWPAEPPVAAPGGGTSPSPRETTQCPPAVSFTSFITGRVFFDTMVCLFVPKTAMGSLGGLGRDLATRPPWSVIGTFVAFGQSTADGFTGCSGFPDFDPAQQGRLRLPCEPPSSPPLVALRVVATGAIWVSGIFLMWRELDSALGKV